jgi:hypothetical protein
VMPSGKPVIKRGKLVRPMASVEKLHLQGFRKFDPAGLTESQLGSLAGDAFNGPCAQAVLICILANLPVGFDWGLK